MTIERAREIFNESQVVVLLTGAGMSADSGLDTFRNTTNSLNTTKSNKFSYAELTTEAAFKNNNEVAWAFHGQRYNNYLNATPHDGYYKLLEMMQQKLDHFVVTSNIDSAHHRTGFKGVYEIHGRLNKFQCLICDDIWTSPSDTFFNIDEDDNLLNVPKCKCGGSTRPNVMFFGYDKGFNAEETNAQSRQFTKFMQQYDQGTHKIALLEIGAGDAVPTIRHMSEFIHSHVPGATLIRINPTDSWIPDDRAVSIKMTALEAINNLFN